MNNGKKINILNKVEKELCFAMDKSQSFREGLMISDLRNHIAKSILSIRKLKLLLNAETQTTVKSKQA